MIVSLGWTLVLRESDHPLGCLTNSSAADDTAGLNMRLRHYMEHIREYHAVSTTFTVTCGMNGCLRQFKTSSA